MWSHSPLNSPLHSLVRHQHGDTPEQDLVARAPEGVEDARLDGAGEGVLAVVREAVVDDSFLGGGAWSASVMG